jgi:DNA modification methylase
MLNIVNIDIKDIKPYERNNQRHPKEQIDKLASQIEHMGFDVPIVIDEDHVIIKGHCRLQALKKLKAKTVPCIIRTDLSEEQKKAARIADNKLSEIAEFDFDNLKLEMEDLESLDFDVKLTGFDDWDLLLDEQEIDAIEKGKSNGRLADRFGIPPFSVLNAREGWWQDRKNSWIGIGIKSGEGREESLLNYSKICALKNGTSIFDPVLTELCYRWFCPQDGSILDPFAGGSVRGIVASCLGRKYTGIDLRQEQVDANNEQWVSLKKEDFPEPKWICDDSKNILNHDIEKCDMIFSCPPYADLEKYSKDKRDLSNLSYPEFKGAYFDIINKACQRLKDDAFACWVVGEVRDKNGNYYNFVGDTIEAFLKAGMSYYNEMILVTSVGSLALRAGKIFSTSRKVGKSHQNVLVFLKGNSKRAVGKLGECEFGSISEDEDSDDEDG